MASTRSLISQVEEFPLSSAEESGHRKGRRFAAAAALGAAALLVALVALAQTMGSATAVAAAATAEGIAGKSKKVPEKVKDFLGSLAKDSLPDVGHLLAEIEHSIPEELMSCLDIVMPEVVKPEKGTDKGSRKLADEEEEKPADTKKCLKALGFDIKAAANEGLPDIQGFLGGAARTGGATDGKSTGEEETAALVAGVLFGHKLKEADGDDPVSVAKVLKSAGLTVKPGDAGQLSSLSALREDKKGLGLGPRGSFELGTWLGVSGHVTETEDEVEKSLSEEQEPELPDLNS